jgi:hypothetical protein
MTISPRKIAWLRYDINTNSLLLAERLVPNFPRAARGTSPKLQRWAARMNRWMKSANSSGPWTFPLTLCSHFVLIAQ